MQPPGLAFRTKSAAKVPPPGRIGWSRVRSGTSTVCEHERVLDADRCRELAGLFGANDYTVDAVVGLIGETAHGALGRNSTLPARRAIRDRTDPLSSLTLLWPLQQPVSRSLLDQALPGLVADLLAGGVLTQADATVR